MIIPKKGIIIPSMGTQKIQMVNVLFPKVRQRVLGLLYRFPECDFYTNEIVHTIQMGTGVVQRELAKLLAAGLVTQTVVGNQKRYQANEQSPLYHELRGIVVKTFGLTDILRQRLELIPKSIKVAFVYGSVAKQTDTANSDIDILLIGNDLTYADFFAAMSETEVQLGRKINPTFYSVDEWKRKLNDNNHFIMKIIDEPKIFLIGGADDLKL